MTETSLLIVLLAAGKGVRMRSDLPKVLHGIGGRPMLGHTLATAQAAGAGRLALVVGPEAGPVRAEAARIAPDIEIFEQPVQAGTGDAVLAARAALERHRGDVLVMFADTPLVEAATLRRLIATLDAGAHLAVLAFEPSDPTGYGRLIADASGRITAVREHKDASDAERNIGLCAAGAMAFRVPAVARLLSRIGNTNASGEYYLTDAIAIAASEGLTVKPVLCSVDEAAGVNSRAQLAAAEAMFQARARRKAMDDGATLIAPETVWFSFDTTIGRDVIVEPNVFFGPGVVVEDGAQILANCHMTSTRIRQGCPCRAVRAIPAGRRHRTRRAYRQLRRGQERDFRIRSQGQPPLLHRRWPGRGRSQRRRRHDLLQLRWVRQALHRCGQGRVHWVQHLAGCPCESG